ncbi:MAG: hypothetical protein QNJ68_17500 [Microcoleaceae cyanobacterium MO_207.B10]|nr:hypothetical protein [Microcoleaceae cyanobacterium MO_207.B10]
MYLTKLGNAIILSKRVKLVESSDIDKIINQSSFVGKLLSGLIRSLESKA